MTTKQPLTSPCYRNVKPCEVEDSIILTVPSNTCRTAKLAPLPSVHNIQWFLACRYTVPKI